MACISSFKFRVQHIRGKQNIVADTLSRMFVDDPRSEEQNPVGCNLLTDFPLAFHDLIALQRQDSELIQIIQDLDSGECVPDTSAIKTSCIIRPGGARIVVPTTAVPMILSFTIPRR